MRKSWFTGFVSVVLSLSFAVSSAAAVPFVLGDLTNDGNVTAEDSAILNQYFAGHYKGKIPFDIDKADIDGDGYLTRQDGMRLARYADGWKTNREYFYSTTTGFAVNPQIVEDGVVGYKTGLAGTVYYYYSKKQYPSPDEFFDNYDYISLNYKGEKRTVGRYETMQFSETYADSYRYMIFMFVDEAGKAYTPLLVDLTDDPYDRLKGSGFSTEPYLADEKTIKFVAERGGTVYWCYVKDGSDLTPAEFRELYAETAETHCGNAVISSGRTLSLDVNGEYVEEYPYVALMLRDVDEACYIPVVVELNSASDHGFFLFPYIIGDTVCFTTTGDGEVWYYYDRTEYSISRSKFEMEYDNASSSRRGTENVTGGVKESITLDEDELDDGYTYIYMAFLPEDEVDDDDKSFCYPIVVDTDDTRTSGTGLTLTIGSESVTVTSEVDGEIRYYFSNDASVKDSSDFKSGYRNAAEDKKRERTVDAGDNRTIDISDYDLDSDEDYLIICAVAIDSNNEYYFTPVVVDLEKCTSSSADSDADFDQTGLRVVRPADGEEITLRSEYTGTVNIYIISTKISSSNDEPIDSTRITKDVDQIVDYSDAAEEIEALLNAPLGSGGFLTKNDFKIRFQLETSDGKFSPIDIDIY